MQLSIKDAYENGMVHPAQMASIFHITLDEVANMTGANRSSLSRSERFLSTKTQIRLKSALEIINMVKPWSGSDLMAYAWYRSEPIPALGNITAESAVKAGQEQAVRDYISAISMGGYA